MSGNESELPDEDLRAVEDQRVDQPQPARGESTDNQGRVAGAIQNVARRARQRAAKQRAQQRRQELEEAKDEQQSSGLISRVFGEDAGDEVSAMLEETGVPSGDDIQARLDVDHDGDGKDLAEELGMTGFEDGGRDPQVGPADDLIERDLQALGQLGESNGATRSFQTQLEDDLNALGQVGEDRDIETKRGF